MRVFNASTFCGHASCVSHTVQFYYSTQEQMNMAFLITYVISNVPCWNILLQMHANASHAGHINNKASEFVCELQIEHALVRVYKKAIASSWVLASTLICTMRIIFLPSVGYLFLPIYPYSTERNVFRHSRRMWDICISANSQSYDQTHVTPIYQPIPNEGTERFSPTYLFIENNLCI